MTPRSRTIEVGPRAQPSSESKVDGADDVLAGCAVAIIMDGNGRWAAEHGVSVTEGHRAGGRALRRTVEAALDLQVAELTVYAFSTENWRRDPEEIAGIMSLLDDLLDSEVPELHEQGVRVSFVGRRDALPESLVDKMEWAETLTGANASMRLAIAFNYGGRAEIVDAAREAAADVGLEGLDEAAIARHLYDPSLREPDLIVRTAGERRTSNFLVWQGAYAELLFVDALWPDFGIDELRGALLDFAGRERRYGGRR